MHPYEVEYKANMGGWSVFARGDTLEDLARDIGGRDHGPNLLKSLQASLEYGDEFSYRKRTYRMIRRAS